MPEMEVEFEVICACRAGLCANTRVSHNRHVPQVIVDPCDQCLARKFEEGKDVGDTEGYDRAYNKYAPD